MKFSGRYILLSLILAVVSIDCYSYIPFRPNDKEFLEKIEDNGIYYNVYGQEDYGDTIYYAIVTARPDGQKYKGNIVIADSVKYKTKGVPVTGVMSKFYAKEEGGAFDDTPELESVKLSECIFMIDDKFFNNSGIKEIIFPKEYISFNGDCIASSCPNLTLRFNSKYTVFGGADAPAWFPDVPIYFEGNVRCSNGCFGGSEIHFGDKSVVLANCGWSNLEDKGPEAGGISLTGRTTLNQFALQKTKAKWIELPVAETIEPFTYFDYFNQCYNTVNPFSERIGPCAFEQAFDLEKLICHDPTPWPAEESAFVSHYVQDNKEFIYEQVKLYVPDQAVATYKADPVWGKFKVILPLSNVVNDVAVDSDESNEKAPVDFFDMMGRRVDSPRSGEMVIRRQGTRTTKVIAR